MITKNYHIKVSGKKLILKETIYDDNETGPMHFLSIKKNEKTISTLCFKVEKKIEHKREREGFIIDVETKKKYRSFGLARKLISIAIKKMKKDYNVTYVHSFSTNRPGFLLLTDSDFILKNDFKSHCHFTKVI